MATDPPGLTRRQIAAFVGKDQEAIRAIERLFTVAGVNTPTDVSALNQSIADLSVEAAIMSAALRALENAVYKNQNGIGLTPYLNDRAAEPELGIAPFTG